MTEATNDTPQRAKRPMLPDEHPLKDTIFQLGKRRAELKAARDRLHGRRKDLAAKGDQTGLTDADRAELGTIRAALDSTNAELEPLNAELGEHVKHVVNDLDWPVQGTARLAQVTRLSVMAWTGRYVFNQGRNSS